MHNVLCSTFFPQYFFSNVEPDDCVTDLPAILQIQMN